MTASLLPIRSHELRIDGLRYHYLDEGSGTPVLLLHGNPTWCYYWRHLAKALSARHRVIVPDHIGCGLSDKPDDRRYSYTLARRVADLEALIEHLALPEKITLVLHDWGGMIGMAYAVRHPHRAARFVILNTAAFHMPTGKRLPLALTLCRSPLGALLVRGLNLFCRGALRTGCRLDSITPEERAAYLAPYSTWRDRIAIHRFIQDIPAAATHPTYALVSEVDAGLAQLASRPMLICWGMNDFVFDADYIAEWRRRFPQAEAHSFADAGHLILEDARAEIVPQVADFLTRTEASLAHGS